MKRRVSAGRRCLLLIFAVMIMGIFGMFVWDESRGEEERAKSTGEAVKQYYQADGVGEEFVAFVDRIFQEADWIDNPKEWKRQVTRELKSKGQVEPEGVSAKIPIQEGKVLLVELHTDLEERTFSVKTWKVLTEEEQREEKGMGVWDGSPFGLE